jgi:hypothetical protein
MKDEGGKDEISIFHGASIVRNGTRIGPLFRTAAERQVEPVPLHFEPIRRWNASNNGIHPTAHPLGAAEHRS